MTWVQRPSGLIKVEGSAYVFRGSYLGVNIDNWSKLLSDIGSKVLSRKHSFELIYSQHQ
jgi:hypothetical protein